jgi:hypothetical protein
MKLCFSIPVHEQPEVIQQQIDNIHHFNPDSLIVLHMSRGFSTSVDRCLINPTQYETRHMSSFLRVHISNFYYVKDIPFEYFVVLASNELFFKHGAYEYMRQYDYGVHNTDNVNRQLYDRMTELAVRHNKHPYSSQIEGIFLKKQLMHEIVSLSNIDLTDWRATCEEEIFFPTMLSNTPYVRGLPITSCEWIVNRPSSIEYVDELIESGLDKPDFYHPNGVFSIKRVARNINDDLRKYIISKQNDPL